MTNDQFQTIQWTGDAATGFLRLIDQTRLPTEYVEMDCRDVDAVWEAIKSLRVRGAPAIGVAAAYGAVIGARSQGIDDEESVRDALHAATAFLRTSRPTAVNLFWALDRMDAAAPTGQGGGRALLERLLAEARRIEDEDRAMCRAIGRHGAALVGPGQGILTHCNAGGLATADYGTALAVIFAAHEQGIAVRVFADETRPLLQGARLTAWELKRRGIPVTLICDNMAAQVMREGKVQMVVVGADRIAANGDTANKIGTYGVALLAKAHAHSLLCRRAVEHLRPARSPTDRPSPSSSATRARSPTASAARPPPMGSRSTTPPSTSPPPSSSPASSPRKESSGRSVPG